MRVHQAIALIVAIYAAGLRIDGAPRLVARRVGRDVRRRDHADRPTEYLRQRLGAKQPGAAPRAEHARMAETGAPP